MSEEGVNTGKETSPPHNDASAPQGDASAQNANNWRRFINWHPFYFGIFPVLFYYAIYAMLQMPPDCTVIPLVVQLLACSLVYFVALALLGFKKPEVSAILASAFWTFFYAIAYLFILDKGLTAISMEGPLRPLIPALFVVIGALLLAGSIMALIKKTPPVKVTSILNGVGKFLVMLEVLVIIGHEFQVKALWEPQLSKLFTAADSRVFEEGLASGKSQVEQKQPDIYFFLLDEFPSNFVLRKFYGYDNEPFLKELEKRGFVVARNSHSNYPRTMLTLSSALNMTYLDQLAPICGAQTTDWSLMFDLVRKGRAIELLKNSGYKYVHLGSTEPPTDWNPHANQNFPCSLLNTYSAKLVLSTLACLLPGTHEYLDLDDRNQRLCQLSTVATLPQDPGKKFVFTHVMMPHEPFLFGPKGQPVRAEEGIDGEVWWKVTRDGFRDQTIFLESKLIEAIDAIIAKSSQQPIIILQGDHGPNSAGDLTKPDPNKNLLVERHGIFSAYLLPEKMRGTIPDTISPVNVFRMVLNDQLGTKFEMLPNKSYYSAYPYPYRFIDVTDKISAQEKVLSEQNSAVYEREPQK